MAQTLTNWEMLLLLDRPSLFAENLCLKTAKKDPRVRVVKSKTPGLASTLNQGITASKANLIARIDQDDLMAPERLEKQVSGMILNPGLVCQGSQIRFIDNSDKLLGKSSYPISSRQLRFSLPATNCIAHPSVIFRKSAVEAVGGYNQTLDGVEDYNLWLRLLRVGQVSNDRECLTFYRLHPKQMSRDNQSINRDLESIARIQNLGLVELPKNFSWAKSFKVMTQNEREAKISSLESAIPIKPRRKLRSFRYLSEFFTSTGVSKLCPLILAIANAPLRSIMLLGLFFYLFRISRLLSGLSPALR